MKKGYVYILTNYTKTVLYVGVTSNLPKRCHEHINKKYEGFTSKYNVKYLIYYEVHDLITSAIKREKTIKSYSRAQKETLIAMFNPEKINLFLDNKILPPPRSIQ